MNEHNKYQDDEIDLIELFETIWDGKWLIVFIVSICLVSATGYLFLTTNSFTATTKIKPITSVEADRYNASNSLGFYNVSPSTLMSALIETLESRDHFVAAFQEVGLLNKVDFPSEEEYNEGLRSLASTIVLVPPQNIDGDENRPVQNFGVIEFDNDNKDKWLNALASSLNLASQDVRATLIARFSSKVELVERQNAFALEDIDTRIENTKADYDKEMEALSLSHEFGIEDLDLKITNALGDYERKISDRLAFLNEQASIARKLGVAKNTIEAQTFSSQNGVVANMRTDSPFYLRGYEAIEKEIELIQSREDKKAFVDGLLELEQEKRAIEQDRTKIRADRKKDYLEGITQLETERRAIQQDQTLERAKELFELTPIMTDDDFKAATFAIESTDFEYKRKTSLILAMSVVLGGMIGAVVVLISGAIRKRRLKSAAT